jgi:hypothetical protein
LESEEVEEVEEVEELEEVEEVEELEEVEEVEEVEELEEVEEVEEEVEDSSDKCANKASITKCKSNRRIGKSFCANRRTTAIRVAIGARDSHRFSTNHPESSRS